MQMMKKKSMEKILAEEDLWKRKYFLKAIDFN